MSMLLDDWKEVTIEECCDILDNQRTPVSSDERAKRIGNIPYYGANGLQGWIDDYIFNEPLILIAEDGGRFEEYATRPIAYQIYGKSWVNNHAHVLRAKKGYCQDMVFYTLEHKDIQSYIVGGTRSKLNQSALKKVKINIPKSLHEQSKIAEVLGSVDKSIEKTEVLIAKQEKIKTGLMQDLLTKGIDQNGNIRSEETHKFKDSPLGRIPVDWEVEIIEKSDIELIDGDRGKNYPKQHEFYDEGYCLFLSAKNVTNRGFVFDNTQFISEIKDKQLGSGKLKREDIVLTTRGTVGNFAYYSNKVHYNNIRINSGMIILRYTGSQLLTEYLYESLKNYIFRTEYRQLISGSAQPQLPSRDLKKFHILIPPYEEQKTILNIIRKVNSEIEITNTELDKMVKLKTALMQDLLKGKKRVTSLLESEEVMT
ncbi:MAG: restriction endonuclease subunit S [Halanaerobiales bacterium]